MWHREDEMFVETGIRGGVKAYGDIGKIVMQGGFIGEDGEITAVESLNGNIGTIVTKLVKKNYDEWAELSADDGANIYASIRARKGSIGKVITVGGSIGNPSCEPGEPEISTIEAAQGIKAVIAKGIYAQGDWAYGGYIHADIFCDRHVGTIKAIAGDILREYEIDPDEYDELLNYAVTIEAMSVKRIQAKGKVFLDRDFEPNPIDWYREAFGGNIGANVSVVKGVDKISAKGGNISIFLHASNGGFKSIKVRRTKYREDNWNDTEPTFRGGNLVDSHITCMPNYVYRDPTGPYTGSLKKLNVQYDIIRCWFGLSGEYPADRIQKRYKYRRLIDSEVWVDGRKVLPR
jgi:hypothetical protein